ncbi:hypothetical protein EZ449_00705 [Pedobacter frigidisoli]|uniref:Uncharacterized protein n=1 Tax=Pedobacter frigidisoli TaxID=2530455 RepID=A0A4R0P6N0_9SPHI|nr:hypothetical protein [Pedobacter frigidisoli]TCD12599.1 hypothetical protein EZ449_00705 [Pedobacter frigidisoli]
MKFLIKCIVYIKHLGIIYRLIGIGLAIALILEAIPDLVFNQQIKNIKNYTLAEVKNIEKERLPRYFGVSDVSAYGDLYVENLRIGKSGDTSLASIVYPVYQNNQDVSKLKETECFVVVIDDKVADVDIEDYFMKNAHVKGKFDNDVIDDESKKILVDGGYKISDKCIVLTKGSIPWETGICLAIIVFAFIGLSAIILSFLSAEKLENIFKNKTIII